MAKGKRELVADTPAARSVHVGPNWHAQVSCRCSLTRVPLFPKYSGNHRSARLIGRALPTTVRAFPHVHNPPLLTEDSNAGQVSENASTKTRVVVGTFHGTSVTKTGMHRYLMRRSLTTENARPESRERT